MKDEEIVAALRASKRRSAVELAELLGRLTEGRPSAALIIPYFKSAFPRIPLGTLQLACTWKRVNLGNDGLSDEEFNDLLREWLEDGSQSPIAPPQ